LRNHGRLDDGRVLDEHAFELERRHLVVRGLEDVVSTADISDVAVCVTAGHIAGVVVAPRRHRVVAA
jgi:hypothetical protein